MQVIVIIEIMIGNLNIIGIPLPIGLPAMSVVIRAHREGNTAPLDMSSHLETWGDPQILLLCARVAGATPMSIRHVSSI